jgi:hypothetical protein
MDYAATADDARASLMEAGALMTLRRTIPGTMDPTKGEVVGASSKDYQVYGLIQSGNPSNSQGQRYFNGILVQTDDVSVLIAAAGLTTVPASGDKLIVGGETYSVVSQIPVQPGGYPIMFRILARK